MAGLPRKYAKLGFKRGWAAYRRAGHGGGRRKHKRGRRRHSYVLGADMMTPALTAPRPVKRLSAGKLLNPVVDLGLIVAGMIVGAMIKKAVPVKNPHLSNGLLMAGGIGGTLISRNRFLKMPALGVALQSTIAEAKILNPKMLPISGDDETVFIPVGDDGQPQLEYMGASDDRVSGENYGADDDLQGENYGADRMAGVFENVEGDDDLTGEGSND